MNNELPLQRKVELIRQKMKDIDRKKAELDQMQTYLAQMLANKLALIDAEENGTAHGNTCVIPEMLTGAFSTTWNICSSRLKGGQPIALFTASEVEGKLLKKDLVRCKESLSVAWYTVPGGMKNDELISF